jgi:hypothetical protein
LAIGSMSRTLAVLIGITMSLENHPGKSLNFERRRRRRRRRRNKRGVSWGERGYIYPEYLMLMFYIVPLMVGSCCRQI